MNQFEFVIAIVAIVMIASVLKARYGVHHRRNRAEGSERGDSVAAARENDRLKEEVQALRDRIAVLERIAVEKESTLE